MLSDLKKIQNNNIKLKKCSLCDNIRYYNFKEYYCLCCGNGLRTRKTYNSANRKANKVLNLNSETIIKTITVNNTEILVKVIEEGQYQEKEAGVLVKQK